MSITDLTVWSIIILLVGVVSSIFGMLVIHHVSGDKREVHLGHTFWSLGVAVLTVTTLIFMWIMNDSYDKRECRQEVAMTMEFNEETVLAITHDGVLNTVCK